LTIYLRLQVCVVLVGNPASGVPSSPGFSQPDDSAVAARYLLEKEKPVNYIKDVLDALQERFLPLSGIIIINIFKLYYEAKRRRLRLIVALRSKLQYFLSKLF
jgi:hypothetical protein